MQLMRTAGELAERQQKLGFMMSRLRKASLPLDMLWQCLCKLSTSSRQPHPSLPRSCP